MVVKAAERIAQHYQLSTEDYLALILAAWFHDTGYSKGTHENHEEESQLFTTSFLTERNVQPYLIDKVNRCIKATQFPTSPNTLIEKILCDADLYHLGTENFGKYTKLLRQEFNNYPNTQFNKEQWRKKNIEFLQQHQYYTDYCKIKLEPTKQKNLKKLLLKNF